MNSLHMEIEEIIQRSSAKFWHKFEKKNGWIRSKSIHSRHQMKFFVFNCKYTWCDKRSIFLVPQIHLVSFKIMRKRRKRNDNNHKKGAMYCHTHSARAHKKGEFFCPSRNLYHCAVWLSAFFLFTVMIFLFECWLSCLVTPNWFCYHI